VILSLLLTIGSLDLEYKYEHLESELRRAPTLLQYMAKEFQRISLMYGKEPVITRILDSVEGSSGVHEQSRAIDFRDEHFNESGERVVLYTKNERLAILHHMRALFPRRDGFKTIIWHRFNGGPGHFHVQCADKSIEQGVEI